MRPIYALMAGAALIASSPAWAADELKFGAPAAWIVPQAIPPASDKSKGQPVALLLHDQQTLLEPGKTSSFSELAFKIQKPEGLAAGNMSIAWNPAFDTVTVNRLEIHRGDQVIDVLKSGQTFTTMRRETNLEMAMLDGVLTANIQPEGLQEGDVVVLATTTEHVDPVMKGHVETAFAPWGSVQIGLAHARLAWPSNLALKLQKTGDLPAPQKSTRDGKTVYELTMRDVEPVIPPKSAPLRYKLGRMGEATDFRSWADAAKLMAPLFRTAAVIPASGPLRDEVEKIRKASADPKVRTELALQLVEQRIRYVALAMGQGGYVPASAETTWSRRFGDCKAKTALLLAILHEFGIEADPVLANPFIGDAIAERLPMLGMFNHVLVRAHVDSKDYWLDGTRTGDTSLEKIKVPNFGWGLPLVDNAQLVHLLPQPLSDPDSETRIEIDASAGVYAPAKVVIDEIVRGDGAVAWNNGYSQLSADQRTEYLHSNAKSYFDTIEGDSATVDFDKTKGELHISTKGTTKLDWKDGWYYVPKTSLAFTPDFDRPAGPEHDAPMATNYPNFDERTVTIKLPSGFALGQKRLAAPVHETIAGVEYARSISLDGGTIRIGVSERSIVPEVPYQAAIAAAPRLRALDKDDVYLNIPQTYRPTQQDLAALQLQTPQSAAEYFFRAGAQLVNNEKDAALVDLTTGLALDPKNAWALAARADILLDKQRLADAEKDLTTGLSIEPANAELLATRGVLAERQHDVASAQQYYEKALQSDPKNYKARLQRAWLLNNKGDRDGAIADMTTLIEESPKNAFTLASRAIMYANKQDFEAAKKDIAAAQALDAKNPMVAIAQQQVAQSMHDLKSAIEFETRIIADNPKDGTRYPARAQTYYEAGKYDLAIKDTDEAIALGYKTPDLRLQRANIFLAMGKPEAVGHEADLLVQENPTSSFAQVAAARTYARMGQIDKAMQAFDRALSIKPEAYVYVNRAQVRPSADVAGQLADLDAALKLEPRMPEALSVKASILAKQGNFVQAIELYDQMPKTGNGSWIETRRAILLAKAGRGAEADKAFADVRAKATTAPELNALCWEKATAGVALASALQDCRDAVKLKPDAGQYLDSLGMVLLKLGKLDEALDAYNQAIAKNTGAPSLMGRAFVYWRKGDHGRAEADATAARKLSPAIDDQFAGYDLKFPGSRPNASGASVKPAPVAVPPNDRVVDTVTVVSVTSN